MPQHVSSITVTHTESQGARGHRAAKACVRMSAPCMASGCEERGMARGQGGRQGGRRPAILPLIPTLAPLVRLRHRDDAPSLLLLGILVTETHKRMKKGGEGGGVKAGERTEG